MPVAKRSAGENTCPVLLSRRERVAHDLVVELGINGVLVKGDSRAAGGAFGGPLTETHDDVGMPCTLRIFERQKEAARRRRVVVVVTAAPTIGIHRPVGSDGQMPDMPQIVGEHRRAEPR
jgi:hypothetical protein